MTRLPRRLALAAAGLVVALAGGWGVLALVLSPMLPASARVPAGAAFAIVVVAALAGLVLGRLRPALLVYAICLVAIVIGWQGLRPTNDADWIPEVALEPTASVDGARSPSAMSATSRGGPSPTSSRAGRIATTT